MSADRGKRAAGWWAAYLSKWWPDARKTPNGVNGPDIQQTPGVAWEVKTSFRGTSVKAALDQARRNALPADAIPAVVYFPPGIGAKSCQRAQIMCDPDVFMGLLVLAGLTGERTSIQAASMTVIDPSPAVAAARASLGRSAELLERINGGK